MVEMRGTQLPRLLATLRDPASGPSQRALAATNVSAAFRVSADDAATTGAVGVQPDRSSQPMFGYSLRHDNAREWDGRSTRSGTITFVDDEWIEQYVGQQSWIAYRQRDLNEPGFVIGDQVRIAAREGRLKIEAIGPNRLADQPQCSAFEIRAGMVILRTLEFDPEEIASTAQITADRYAGNVRAEGDAVTVGLPGGAHLVIIPFALDEAHAAVAIVADLVDEPFRAAVRLEIVLTTSLADAALEAERALAYCAALLATRGKAIAIDDTWAIFSAEELYDLGVRDETRAAVFSLAASAAQSAFPAQTMQFSERRGVCDELTVYSSRPWRADFASAFITRLLEALSDAKQRTDDPIVPTRGKLYSNEEHGAAGTLQPLASLSYETVELEIFFLDTNVAGSVYETQIEARQDVATLLGDQIRHAVVMTFENKSADTASACFALEMQRADTLATALAASFARRTDGIAIDLNGALYCADELLELALQRRGKAASWTARVASVLTRTS